MSPTDFYRKHQVLQPADLLSWIGQNIIFGWRDYTGFTHPTINDPEAYALQTPIEILTSRTGICWDVVELMRDWFSAMSNLPIQTYYIFYDDGAGKPIAHITVMNAISLLCDCAVKQDDPVMHDLGIVASLDPVANDQAFVDFIYASDEPGAIELQKEIDRQEGRHILEYAEALGLGSRDYELIEI